MKFWKPFERWTEVKGDRTEHQIHADFEIDCSERLDVYLFTESGLNWTIPIVETPPPGKVYRVHIKISLEEFDSGEK